MVRMVGVVSVLLVMIARAEMREWTARSGATVQAEWVGEGGGQVRLRTSEGKEVGIALHELSESDQAYVKSLRPRPGIGNTTPSLVLAPSQTNRMTLGGVEVKKGEMITFMAPLPEGATKELKKEKNTVVAEARIGVAVPNDFDPARPQRVLVVSATSDNNSMSIGHAGQHQREALARGWVVMAADPPTDEPPAKHSNTWRWSLIQAGLAELHAAWPGSRNWAYATGGFSGGAKRSGYIAALLAKENYRVIGMLMGGCNDDMASKGLAEYSPKRAAFLKIPILLSVGDADRISTVQHAQRVRDAMRATGFKEVRLEIYSGGHSLHPPHTDAALAWFEEKSAPQSKP